MKISILIFLFQGLFAASVFAQESIDLNLALRFKNCDMNSSGQTRCAETMSPVQAAHIILNRSQGSVILGQASILAGGPGFNSQGVISILKTAQASGGSIYSVQAAMDLAKTGTPLQPTEQGSAIIGNSLQNWQPGTGMSFGGEQYYLTRTHYIVASIVVWKTKLMRKNIILR